MWHQVLHNLAATVWTGMVMASAEHSDHQTMLLMVPKPATPIPPSPSLHVYFLLSGEQPKSPSLPANRPCPQRSSCMSPSPPPWLLLYRCRGEHLHSGATTTEDRPLFIHTHGPMDTGSLRTQAISHSSFYPKAWQRTLSKYMNQWTSRTERKAWKTKGEEHKQQLIGSELLILSEPGGKSKTKQWTLPWQGSVAPTRRAESCDCGVIKIQGNSAVPSRRQSGWRAPGLKQAWARDSHSRLEEKSSEGHRDCGVRGQSDPSTAPPLRQTQSHLFNERQWPTCRPWTLTQMRLRNTSCMSAGWLSWTVTRTMRNTRSSTGVPLLSWGQPCTAESQEASAFTCGEDGKDGVTSSS